MCHFCWGEVAGIKCTGMHVVVDCRAASRNVNSSVSSNTCTDTFTVGFKLLVTDNPYTWDIQ